MPFLAANLLQALYGATDLFAVGRFSGTPAMFGQAEKLALIMDTPPQALEETAAYLQICSLGIPFIVAFNVIAAVLRGLGDSRTPMYIAAIACTVHAGGDLALAGIFRLGVTGVAAATVAAQGISSVCGVWMIRRRELSFSLARNELRWNGRTVKAISVTGLPIATQDTLINLSLIKQGCALMF